MTAPVGEAETRDGDCRVAGESNTGKRKKKKGFGMEEGNLFGGNLESKALSHYKRDEERSDVRFDGILRLRGVMQEEAD